ncbi:MAG: LAGLIDADG family homing endonuclease [Candidatus Levybacteria bacterium]|nr:LAGLIDADG family homing endonuclease [Candidatus Levybacteria bacterium]
MPSKNVLSADNQQATKQVISNEYLAGFTDGEGCFYVGFSKRLDLPLRWQVITEFHVSQNPGGKNVLEEFRKRLGCGYLKPNHPRNLKDKSWILIVKDRDDLMEKVIPFFKKYPLFTTKRSDFEVFEQVLSLVKTGEHLQKDGFKKIVELVFSAERTTNKRYSKETLLA